MALCLSGSTFCLAVGFLMDFENTARNICTLCGFGKEIMEILTFNKSTCTLSIAARDKNCLKTGKSIWVLSQMYYEMRFHVQWCAKEICRNNLREDRFVNVCL